MHNRIAGALVVGLLGIVGSIAPLGLTGCAAPTDEEEGETGSYLSSGDTEEADVDEDIVGKTTEQFVGHFPSPSIVRDGSDYHVYLAKQSIGGKVFNIAHAVRHGDGKWKLDGDALPKLGAKAAHSGAYAVWAPAVAKISDKHWVLYYSSTLAGTKEKKCIWRAHATKAEGPFVDDFNGPIECQDGSLWTIDPYLVKDGGDWYLSARVDKPGGINTIQIRKLADNGLHYADGSKWKELVHNAPSSWEQPVLENAAIVKLAPPDGKAHWFVFYSGGAWAKDSYAVGYADCGTSIDGPCVKKTPDHGWLRTDPDKKLFGPGTPTFYNDESGRTMMAVQAWQHQGGKANGNNHGQIMNTYKVTVGNGYRPSADLVRTDL